MNYTLMNFVKICHSWCKWLMICHLTWVFWTIDSLFFIKLTSGFISSILCKMNIYLIWITLTWNASYKKEKKSCHQKLSGNQRLSIKHSITCIHTVWVSKLYGRVCRWTMIKWGLQSKNKECSEPRKQLICSTMLPEFLGRNYFGPKFGHLIISALRSTYRPTLQAFKLLPSPCRFGAPHGIWILLFLVAFGKGGVNRPGTGSFNTR